jgi:YVTN family beta-propeller protein
VASGRHRRLPLGIHARSWHSDGVRRAAVILAALLGLAAAAVAVASVTDGRIGPDRFLTANGRQLVPAGRLTTVGDFPTGGALTPDGHFYWAVDAGHGHDDVQVVAVGTGDIVQNLVLPGASGGVAFAPGGRTAYVSGEPKGDDVPDGPTVGDAGDVIHVFGVDPATGHATERTPIQLPATSGGTAQSHGAKTGWPQELAVTPDGKRLVVALNQADQVAIVDLSTGVSRLVKVGRYPYGVAIDPDGTTAYVTDEYDGDVSLVDIAAGTRTGTIPVGGSSNPDGGPNPNQNAHPEGIVVDPHRTRAYVAVTNRDRIAVIGTKSRSVVRYIDVGRPAGFGAAPVALGLAPDGRTLYSADSGEDAVAAISLTARPDLGAYQVIGKIPTAAYTADVEATPDGSRLVWLAAKGLGAGPNPAYNGLPEGGGSSPYGSFVLDKLLGRVGVVATPDDAGVRTLTPQADKEVKPANARSAPAGTPLRAGGPIKHVFYVVRENRTYDQILGSEPRGDGDPSLEVADDNGAGGPAAGVTPNAHKLARQFPLLDHVYADSEVTRDGHKITAGAYATDFAQKAIHANYGGRGKQIDLNSEPAAAPPRDFIFDQAVRQGISFRNYGERAAETSAQGNDGRPTYAASVAGKDNGYPGGFGCHALPVNATDCDTDAGTPGLGTGQQAGNSRFDYLEAKLSQQISAGTLPALDYLILPNDHTDGTTPGYLTPRALIADNDLGLGQLVDFISHSSIWSSSAIFVVEDDSQDGPDHVDAHRMPAFVISPWARHGEVVHTRYDQLSVLRSIEIILGMKPLSLFDGLATPMYNAFTTTPDPAPYTAVAPTYPRTATNPANAADAALSAAMPFNAIDAVPQEISDRILWHSVHGAQSQAPGPGPDASPAERTRAHAALRAYRHGKPVKRMLLAGADRDG